MDRRISAVIVSRNDNYGDNLHHRAKLVLTDALSKYDEVVYIDWKPVNDISLIDAIKKEIPHANKLKHIKIDKSAIEKYLPNCINYSIVETVGRNVGIRNTSMDWIVSTNIDVVTNNLNLDELNKNCFYTGRRMDVKIDHHINCKDTAEMWNVLNRNQYAKKPSTVVNGQPIWDPGDIWSLVVCCGDFQIAHKNVWDNIRGFEESITGRVGADANIMKKAKVMGFDTAIFETVNVYHLNHATVSYKQPGEILPINNVYDVVAGWTPTTTENKENWGMRNLNLTVEVI